MKKFILFRILLIFYTQLIFVSCFSLNKDSISIALISVSHIECEECSMLNEYEEISSFISSIRGIKDVGFYLNQNNIILILAIEYNSTQVDINNLKMAISSKGYFVNNFSSHSS